MAAAVAYFCSATIRESAWLFPAIEVVHLLALAVMGGAVLMTALSVFGVGLKSPPKDVEATTRPFMTWSVVGLLVTGLLLGASEPVKLIDREAFLIKMVSLALALLFTYLVFNPIVRKGETGVPARAAADNPLSSPPSLSKRNAHVPPGRWTTRPTSSSPSQKRTTRDLSRAAFHASGSSRPSLVSGAVKR